MDTELVTDFKSTLLKLMEDENLTPCQVFNASETDLYYKMMPNEILVHTTEHSMPGYKKIKDRLTVMACANATGLKKIPLLIVGRFEKPRSIKNLAPHLLPVKYASHPNAMLSAKIFETWFKDDFVPHVLAFLRSRGLPEKAILLLDNIKLHLSASVLTVGGIRAVFLPTNITKLIQPMDQGVIEEIKNRYRSKLLTFIMNVQGIGQSYNEAMKGFNVKHAINFVSDAWEEVMPKTICTCWKDLLNLPVEPIDQSEIITPEYIHEASKNIPQFENITLEEVNKWIKVDTDNITDEDIVQAVQCTDNVKIEPETNDFADAEIDPTKALEAADCLLLFFEKTEISVSDIKVLRRLRQRIEKLKENS
nr:PREDICTED: jerky protein homolog-like [Megachile rotundata]XP_012154410.1 PREDICTED: jerky protein homolog-like [Megachile rotundata]